MNLINDLEKYHPFNQQEEKDKELLLYYLKNYSDLYTRDNETMHLTASAWVVSPDKTKVLMAYHNIYNSWSWLGGHLDGEEDLTKVAIKEVCEESGLKHVKLLDSKPFSIEILTVEGHQKNGKYVSSHLHLNVTYLIEANPNDPIFIKEDENSNVGWFDLEAAVSASSEPWFRERIYSKLNEKLLLREKQNK